MKQILSGFTLVFLIIIAGLCVVPLLFLATGSLMDSSQLNEFLKPIYGGISAYVKPAWIPDRPTMKFYAQLLDTPEFFIVFWNSVKITVSILFAQLLIGIPAAWALARFKLPGMRTIYFLYIVLMLMPFQVTMLSSYLVLNQLRLLGKTMGVVFLAAFSTFPVFIMYRFFKGIPEAIIESAQLDGANQLRICVHIGVPLGSAGVISMLILGFLEYWNMIEQPMTFLKDQKLWPLALYLPNVNFDKAGYILAGSVVTLLPSLFLFFGGQDYLEQGIAATAVKE